jgi:hypothetical protein
MALTHCKIKVHTHVFCKCDENCRQNSKVHCLLNVHDLDFFCIIGKLIVLTLHKWVPFLIFQRNIYLKIFKYVENIGKIANTTKILGHRSV